MYGIDKGRQYQITYDLNSFLISIIGTGSSLKMSAISDVELLLFYQNWCF